MILHSDVLEARTRDLRGWIFIISDGAAATVGRDFHFTKRSDRSSIRFISICASVPIELGHAVRLNLIVAHFARES